MSKPSKKQIVAALLKRHGRFFSSELGIKLGSNSPSALFRWLCAALLFSARIGNEIATEAARALSKQGWTTAKKMTAATWGERTRVLNHAGYARYDEKTSRMLAATSDLLLERYGGDLRDFARRLNVTRNGRRSFSWNAKVLAMSVRTYFCAKCRSPGRSCNRLSMRLA